MKPPNGLYSLLTLPTFYRLFDSFVRGDSWRVYISEYVRPVPGEKVLDIGCGPGDILENLPDVDYLGFDINPKYVEAAQKRYGIRGRFFCGDVGLTAIDQEAGSFDLVLATGVLHHLDDDRAVSLFKLARRALKPGGRLVTYDGCFVAGQPRLARFVVSRDRGQYVRKSAEYVKLAVQVFPQVKPFVRHDLLRIPYSHVILQCG
ncbi:MAG TPA: class I SAM-dependent methyltransferase [Chthoniobacterales bacterium]|jgi:SAM-dependent methyltransferase|nr:class I SAM-dependent methyltransferase [Chthoniobacterales bacterium]